MSCWAPAGRGAWEAVAMGLGLGPGTHPQPSSSQGFSPGGGAPAYSPHSWATTAEKPPCLRLKSPVPALCVCSLCAQVEPGFSGARGSPVCAWSCGAPRSCSGLRGAVDGGVCVWVCLWSTLSPLPKKVRGVLPWSCCCPPALPEPPQPERGSLGIPAAWGGSQGPLEAVPRFGLQRGSWGTPRVRPPQALGRVRDLRGCPGPPTVTPHTQQ